MNNGLQALVKVGIHGVRARYHDIRLFLQVEGVDTVIPVKACLLSGHRLPVKRCDKLVARIQHDINSQSRPEEPNCFGHVLPTRVPVNDADSGISGRANDAMVVENRAVSACPG